MKRGITVSSKQPPGVPARAHRRRVLALTLLPLMIGGCFVLSLAGNQELPNFHEVNSQLYRGAQPKPDGLKRLAGLGVKTILNLRAGNELAQREETETRALGMRYFNVPMSRTGRPTDEQIDQVLAILEKPANQPVFVHCQHGADRTGVAIAIYRITHDGWTSERARAEANKYGMHPWEIGMKSYIHEFYQRRQKPKAPNAKPI